MGAKLTESFPKRMISDSKNEIVDHDQQVPALSCDLTDVAGNLFISVKVYPSFLVVSFALSWACTVKVKANRQMPTNKLNFLIFS
ncbi:MAG: hypothetical protein BWY27_00351 [Bacteroidetes bacterium ADurb.Bin234]|nr:MAG: hypothetical protein BWY27_00351 [Bacteroidetes bacterium ADurb.Bin234]